MLAAISRQLGMIARSAAATATPATLRRRRLGDLIQLLLIEQPDPLRFRLLRLLGLLFAALLSLAHRAAFAFRRTHLAQTDQHLFAQTAVH